MMQGKYKLFKKSKHYLDILHICRLMNKDLNSLNELTIIISKKDLVLNLC